MLKGSGPHRSRPAGHRQPREAADGFDPGETLAGYVYREQRIVTLGTLAGETRFPGSVSIMREAGLQSVCALPLTVTLMDVPLSVVASGRPLAYAMAAGPMAEPKTLKMEPWAMEPLGSRGSEKLAAFLTPCAAMDGAARDGIAARKIVAAMMTMTDLLIEFSD